MLNEVIVDIFCTVGFFFVLNGTSQPSGWIAGLEAYLHQGWESRAFGVGPPGGQGSTEQISQGDPLELKRDQGGNTGIRDFLRYSSVVRQLTFTEKNLK